MAEGISGDNLFMQDAERALIEAEFTSAVDLWLPPRQATPLVFCSPHSGRIYPQRFMASSRLDALGLRKSEDCYVDELFRSVTELGAPLLAARFPRAYVDVNREPYELDPELFRERLPASANTQSIRVIGGLGTIPRVVADAEDIYRERLPLAVGLARIEVLYRPFHAALASLIATTHQRFGVAVRIDCHSLPSASTGHGRSQRPHFVVGDRFATACEPRLTRLIRDTLTGYGYDVQLNRPYAGGFITEHYGQPAAATHAVQIEINRALYLDEASLQRTSGFTRLRHDLMRLVERLAASLPVTVGRSIAAE